MNIKKNRKSSSRLIVESTVRRFNADNHVRWGILAFVAILFTLILYPGLIITKQPYQLGDVAENDIKASKVFFVEDEKATEEKRRKAEQEVLTVYDHDIILSSKLCLQVKEAFNDLRNVLESEKKLQSKNSSKNIKISPAKVPDKKEDIHDRIWRMKKEFDEKIGIEVSKGAYKILVKEEFDEKISNPIIKVLSTILRNGVVANKEILLKDNNKGIILRGLATKSERVVRNLKLYYSLDQAKTMVRIIGNPLINDLNYTLVNLIVDFTQRLIQPNITINRSETEERKKIAGSEINPVLYKIKAGEMLLREGERVTDVQLLKLKALQSHVKKEKILGSRIGASILIMCLLITVYTLYLNHQKYFFQNHNKNLVFIASVLITFFLLARISASLSETVAQNSSMSDLSISFGVPMAAGAMIICLFFGFEIAIAFAIIIAVGSAFIFQNRLEIFIYFLINSSMAAYWIRDCRERKVFIKAGLKIGLLNMALAAAINIYLTDFSGWHLLWDPTFAFLSGIIAGIIAAGIAPLVEIAFDYTTDIKLLELANLDRPILRKLLMEAPGTYHHSVIVGSMVEAAAAEIGANPLSAKVSGYYHDIGKIKKPLYFIENQTDGKNKHDKLAPSMSSLILISHIKDGVEIAEKNKLGRIITDAIRQHHGTSLISFFYEKAKKLKGENAVNIDDFRYPGPRPQTKEAGLVMLADVVEAASRTLDNPTPSRIRGLVQNLLNKVSSDGQLDDCELTLKDLHKIAKSFNNILNGIYHNRIEYPENPAAGNGKEKNGSPDKEQAKKIQNISGNNKAAGPDHLKRLGIS